MKYGVTRAAFRRGMRILTLHWCGAQTFGINWVTGALAMQGARATRSLDIDTMIVAVMHVQARV